jgi:hypothetical protein
MTPLINKTIPFLFSSPSFYVVILMSLDSIVFFLTDFFFKN